MSWVTNVVLFYSTGEEFIDVAVEDDKEDIQDVGISACLTKINVWLSQQGWVELVNIGDCVSGRERHSFECSIWGAAFNHLDIEAFLKCVKCQDWQEPDNVQVMVKDQEEERFTVYHLSGIGGAATA